MQLPRPEYTDEERAYLQELAGRGRYDPNRLCPNCEAPIGEHRYGGVDGSTHHPAPIKWVEYRVGDGSVMVSPQDRHDLENDLRHFGTSFLTTDTNTGRGKRIDPSQVLIKPETK